MLALLYTFSAKGGEKRCAIVFGILCGVYARAFEIGAGATARIRPVASGVLHARHETCFAGTARVLVSALPVAAIVAGTNDRRRTAWDARS